MRAVGWIKEYLTLGTEKHLGKVYLILRASSGFSQLSKRL